MKGKINPDNDGYDPSEEYFQKKGDTYENEEEYFKKKDDAYENETEEYFPEETSKPPHY